MQITKDDIETLMHKVNYINRHDYKEQSLNELLNYWMFLDGNEELIQNLLSVTIEEILYSKYYWCSRFIEEYTKMYGTDAGYEQQLFQILEDMEHRIEVSVR